MLHYMSILYSLRWVQYSTRKSCRALLVYLKYHDLRDVALFILFVVTYIKVNFSVMLRNSFSFLFCE